MVPPDKEIENKYSWLKAAEEIRDQLSGDPSKIDHTRAYGTMVMIYQDQRTETLKILERLENALSLRTMPRWGRTLSIAVALEGVAIVVLYVFLLHAR